MQEPAIFLLAWLLQMTTFNIVLYKRINVVLNLDEASVLRSAMDEKDDMPCSSVLQPGNKLWMIVDPFSTARLQIVDDDNIYDTGSRVYKRSPEKAQNISHPAGPSVI